MITFEDIQKSLEDTDRFIIDAQKDIKKVFKEVLKLTTKQAVDVENEDDRYLFKEDNGDFIKLRREEIIKCLLSVAEKYLAVASIMGQYACQEALTLLKKNIKEMSADKLFASEDGGVSLRPFIKYLEDSSYKIASDATSEIRKNNAEAFKAYREADKVTIN